RALDLAPRARLAERRALLVDRAVDEHRRGRVLRDGARLDGEPGRLDDRHLAVDGEARQLVDALHDPAWPAHLGARDRLVVAEADVEHRVALRLRLAAAGAEARDLAPREHRD